jgi:murein L,D-transpeptidase YafK
LVRSLLASAAIAAAVALAGCETDGTAPTARSLQPISDKMLAEIEKKQMTRESPILVRLFKEEAELEVWKQDQTGRMALLKTYPICRWSGELGPKIKEGDRQAPEGFYAITPSLLNPNSSYYLAINLGFPNTFDRAHGRTGAFLMIHGDCSSRGCYAMTDEQIGEIYALARESFFGGQRAFQVQAYPFRMTAANMAKHRNNPHMPFWRMLKEGNDHFEVTRLEPKVDVCERRYVFNAYAPGNPETPLRFNAAGRCPVYEVPADVVASVNEKNRQDQTQIATLTRRGTPAAPVKTGLDGGMNKIFLAALKPTAYDSDGRIMSRMPGSLPGTMPPHTVPPGEKHPIGEGTTTASVRPGATYEPTAATSSSYTVAAAESRPAAAQSSGSSGGLFGNLFSSSGGSQGDGVIARMARAIGIGDGGSPRAPIPASQVPTPRPKPGATRTAYRAPGAIRTTRQTESSDPSPTANAGAIRRPATEPRGEDSEMQTASRARTAAPVISGAQPAMPTGTFSSRWDAFQ